MKILHICQSYPPMISGASLAVAQLASGFAQDGHDVLVIAASDSRRGYMAGNGRLHIKRLSSWHNPARVNQRFLLWPQRQIQAIADTFRPDVIHLHEPLALGICGLRAAKKLNVPAILTLHQLPEFVTKYTSALCGNALSVEQLLWRYGRWLLGQCAATIVPMAHSAATVQQFTGHHAHVIPYGIDLYRFSTNLTPDEAARLRCKYGLSPHKPIILHVGRLDRDKDVHHVIHAAAKLFFEVDAELLVVGDGTQRHILMALCETLGIAERCHFPGYVDPDGDLTAVYQLASVFVTASEIETFGIVILEAMAAACPVVAVNATCLPDLVDDNSSGFLVPPKDTDALAAKIGWLLQNPRAIQVMGQRGRKLSRRFEQSSMLSKHLQLYLSVCLNYSTRPLLQSAISD